MKFFNTKRILPCVRSLRSVTLNNMVIHIISYAFLGFITYLFIINFNIFDTLQIIIFSISYFATFMFISDQFKLSEFKVIKFLQVLVFIFTIFGFIALILYLLDISIFDTVFCDNSTSVNLNNKFKMNMDTATKSFIVSNSGSDSHVLTELNKQNPNWKDLFIKSPLENTELLRINRAIEYLNINLTLQFIILYLIFMVLFIFTSKLLIENNIKLEGLKKLPLGYYIELILSKIIKMWTINANI